MDIIVILGYLGVIISGFGIVMSISLSIATYRHMKKEDSRGKYKEYVQPHLTNSEIPVSDAVDYLKIVNFSEESESKLRKG